MCAAAQLTFAEAKKKNPKKNKGQEETGKVSA